MPDSLRIISRNSKLAISQSQYVKEQLNRLYPNIVITIEAIATVGDKLTDRPLNSVGGKGLFTKELEIALINGDADLAVHSAKDMASVTDKKFTIAAFLEREEAADAFISNKAATIDELPLGSVIGTSSARRIALLNKYYPKYTVKLLRGNVPTRLAKLDAGEYDGIILAVAGLKRLGLASRINQRVDTKIFIPCIGQGALAVEVLSANNELFELVAKLDHADTNLTVMTERQVGKILQANCNVPLGVHAVLKHDTIYLDAFLADKENSSYCEFSGSAKRHDAKALANRCADNLIEQGALTILQRYD